MTLKLGRQAYLLDSYLFLFMEEANAMLAYEAGSDGFERGGELRSLCFDVLDRNGTEKDHPFYDTALNALIGRVDIMRCQEDEDEPAVRRPGRRIPPLCGQALSAGDREQDWRQLRHP